MTRNWTIGKPAWCWPDDVDKTGTEDRCGLRYMPVLQTDPVGYQWHVAKVFVDEDDDEMLADARLIASAPDLLRIVEQMAIAIEGEGEFEMWDEDWQANYRAAKAVLNAIANKGDK